MVGVPIPMVQDPMVLIGEDHKSTRNAEPGYGALRSCTECKIIKLTVVKRGKHQYSLFPEADSLCFRESTVEVWTTGLQSSMDSF